MVETASRPLIYLELLGIPTQTKQSLFFWLMILKWLHILFSQQKLLLHAESWQRSGASAIFSHGGLFFNNTNVSKLENLFGVITCPDCKVFP